jgi:hypothetical protein
MLWTPGNEFNWTVDNFGATFTDAGLGTNSPGHLNANQKGANTNIISGIAEDCYGLAICLTGGNTSGAARRQLTDILIDPAAGVGNVGSSWSTFIANLASCGPSFSTVGAAGYWYYFPIYLKAGTAIGTAHQDSTATTQALRVSIRVYGKPSRPDLLKVGTRVQTLGVSLGTTVGATVTPGSSGTMGSYSSSLGTLSFDAWWWQVGILTTDTSMTAASYLFDVAVNATNKIICMENVQYIVAGAVEQTSKSAIGSGVPYRMISSGQDVYVRGVCTATPDSSMSAVVYALGS